MSVLAVEPVGLAEDDYRIEEDYVQGTASQKARSSYYVTLTGAASGSPLAILGRQVKSAHGGPAIPAKGRTISDREHVNRLLRDCKRLVNSMVLENDVVEAGILGAELLKNLQGLWERRKVREEDWVEILNILQIVLQGAEFESFNEKQRRALQAVFEEGLLVRTVGRKELARSVNILSSAGFDLWRGIEEGPESNQDRV